MVRYRRNKPGNPDDIFFLTIVTADRFPFFCDPTRLEVVKNAVKRARVRHGVRFKAWVILPNHLHWLMVPGKADYSKVISFFKRSVGASMRNRGLSNGVGYLWQDRFWEHTIRDDDDYWNSVEYIHYNPVKHGLVKSPAAWEYSSFREFVRRGIYEENWADGGSVEVGGAEFD
jgi:putative transposase